jgi:hypothetical protein
MADENQVAGEQVELTEEQKAAQAEQERVDAEAKAKAEADAAQTDTGAEGAAAAGQQGTPILEGSVVLYTLAIGEVRDAVVRTAHDNGTLNLAVAITDADLPYVPENEREQKEIVRFDVALGEAGVVANTWWPKPASDQAGA